MITKTNLKFKTEMSPQDGGTLLMIVLLFDI